MKEDGLDKAILTICTEYLKRVPEECAHIPWERVFDLMELNLSESESIKHDS